MISVINKLFMITLMISVTGSISALIILLFKNVIFKCTSAGFTSKIYIISMVSFIIPLFFFISVDNFSVQFVEFDPYIIVGKDSIEKKFYSGIINIKFAEIITIIWFIGLILYLAIKIYSYICFRKNVREDCITNTNAIWNETLVNICEEYHIRNKNIKLEYCESINYPCTIGIRDCHIIIPKYLRAKLSDLDIEILLRHELIHIKKRDTALKTFTFILSSLNWFNILMSAFKEDMYEWIECARDEQITHGRSGEFKKAYADMLIKLSEKGTIYSKNTCTFNFGSSKNYDLLKRRIYIIMGNKNKKNGIARTAILVGIISTILCATAVANEIDTAIINTFSCNLSIIDEENVSITGAEENDENFIYKYYAFDERSIENAVVFSPDKTGDSYVIYEDGTVEHNFRQIEVEPQHTHTFINVNINEHKKHSDGSCTVTIYAAKKCTGCGKIYKGDVINRITYEICPH